MSDEVLTVFDVVPLHVYRLLKVEPAVEHEQQHRPIITSCCPYELVPVVSADRVRIKIHRLFAGLQNVHRDQSGADLFDGDSSTLAEPQQTAGTVE